MDQRLGIKRNRKRMKNLVVVFILLGIISCKKEIKSLTDLKSDFYEIQLKPFHLGDTVKINFNANQDKIDSVSLLVNGKALKKDEKLDLNNSVLGANELEIYVYLKSHHIYGKNQMAVLNPEKETAVEYEVIKEYPHNPELFTQGFLFHNDKIYESSGQYGKSKLVNYALGSTTYLKEEKLDPKIFAEGSCMFNGKWYVLTYRERKILVYDPETFELLETLPMPSQMKEGWGLTTDGKEFIASDGTQNIFFFTDSFEYKRRIQVTGNVSIYTYINDLAYIDGKIFANVWQTPFILIINPQNGAVEKYYDLSSLNEAKGPDDVLNGVTLYKGNLLVTGKNWTKIYEVNLPN